MHLLGARRQVVPYQGSKWRVRRALADLAAELGFEGPPAQVSLVDPGPWGVTAALLAGDRSARQVLAEVRALVDEDPGALYRRLHGAPVPRWSAPFAAEHLVLQRLAFSGKAVGITPGGRWRAPGLNATSAYGTPATERFGAVRPQLLALVDALAGLTGLAEAWVGAVRGDATLASAALLSRSALPTLVYLDPPYAGTTPYPDGAMDLRQVGDLARRWADMGAAVIVSERAGLDLGDGWQRRRLDAGRGGASPFRGGHEEWVTYCPVGG